MAQAVRTRSSGRTNYLTGKTQKFSLKRISSSRPQVLHGCEWFSFDQPNQRVGNRLAFFSSRSIDDRAFVRERISTRNAPIPIHFNQLIRVPAETRTTQPDLRRSSFQNQKPMGFPGRTSDRGNGFSSSRSVPSCWWSSSEASKTAGQSASPEDFPACPDLSRDSDRFPEIL